MRRRPPRSTRTDTLFPYTTLFRSQCALDREAYSTVAARFWMRAAISDVATGPFDGYIKFPIAVGPFQTQQDKFMTEDSKSKTAAMQGGGFYNRNSTLQAANLTSALPRSEEHTSELQSLMRISYAAFCLKKKNTNN